MEHLAIETSSSQPTKEFIFEWDVQIPLVKGQKSRKSSEIFETESSPGMPAMAWKFECVMEHKSSPKMLAFTITGNPKGNGKMPSFKAWISRIGENASKKRIHSSKVQGQNFLEFREPATSLGVTNEIRFRLEVVLSCYLAVVKKLDTTTTNILTHKWNSGLPKGQRFNPPELLRTGRFSDVEIVSSDNVKFCAHQLILKEVNAVFARYLCNESMTGVLTFNDLSEQAVSFLLHFLYSGELLPISMDDDETNRSNATISEVLYLVHKFQLIELFNHIDETLHELCNESNSFDLLKLCRLWPLSKAKDAILEIMMTKQRDFVKNFLFGQA